MDRSQLRTVSYKGVAFLCVNTDNTFGRRLIVHEFPQFDNAFVEDMGRGARRFSVSGFFAGADWESRRDELIAACEEEGPGNLIHPEFGEIQCACESISVSESKRDSLGTCEITIDFVEAQSEIVNWEFTDTQSALTDLQPDAFTSALNWLNDAALFVTEQINDVFELAGEYVGLIQGVIPTHLISTLSNINLSDPFNVGSSIQTTLNSIGVDVDTDTYEGAYSTARNDVELRRNLTRVGIDTSTSYWSLPASNKVKRATEPVVNTKEAMNVHSKILDINGTLRTGTAVIPTLNNKYYKLTRDFTRVCTIVNMAKLSTEIDYESNEQAFDTWQEIQTNINATISDIQTEKHYKQDVPIEILTKTADLLIQDIQARAPEKKNIKTISVARSIPSLVLSHLLHGDTSRELDIVARNHINHPGFCSGNIQWSL